MLSGEALSPPAPAEVSPSVGTAEERLSVDVEDELEEESSATDTETAGSAPPLKVSEEEDLPILELDTDEEEEEYLQPATAEPAVEPAPPQPAAEPAAKPAPSKVPAAPAATKPAGPIDPLAKQILLAGRAAHASDVHMKSGEIPILRVAGRLVQPPEGSRSGRHSETWEGRTLTS